jgi:hypothetical protein
LVQEPDGHSFPKQRQVASECSAYVHGFQKKHQNKFAFECLCLYNDFRLGFIAVKFCMEKINKGE